MSTVYGSPPKTEPPKSENKFIQFLSNLDWGRILFGAILALVSYFIMNTFDKVESLDDLTSNLSSETKQNNSVLMERVDFLIKNIDKMDKKIDGLDNKIDLLSKDVNGIKVDVGKLSVSIEAKKAR